MIFKKVDKICLCAPLQRKWNDFLSVSPTGRKKEGGGGGGRERLTSMNIVANQKEFRLLDVYTEVRAQRVSKNHPDNR